MTVSALIQFTQGATVTPAGRAMVGSVGAAVSCVNDDDTGVISWTWTMESVPIGSALPTGVIGTGNVVGFVPDIHGSYLVSLRVQGTLSTDVSTDYRVFAIVNEMGWIIPAFHGRADAHNFGGQLRGWAGTATYQMLDEMFLYITDMLKGADENDVLTYSGGVWGPKPGGGSGTGTFTGNIRTVTGPTTDEPVVATDGIIECDTSLGSISFLLSNALPDGQVVIFKDVSGSAAFQPIYINCDFPDYIDGVTQFVIRENYGSMIMQRQTAPPASNNVWGSIAEYKQRLTYRGTVPASTPVNAITIRVPQGIYAQIRWFAVDGGAYGNGDHYFIGSAVNRSGNAAIVRDGVDVPIVDYNGPGGEHPDYSMTTSLENVYITVTGNPSHDCIVSIDAEITIVDCIWAGPA